MRRVRVGEDVPSTATVKKWNQSNVPRRRPDRDSQVASILREILSFLPREGKKASDAFHEPFIPIKSSSDSFLEVVVPFIYRRVLRSEIIAAPEGAHSVPWSASQCGCYVIHSCSSLLTNAD